jgi:pSer/pThr/pTyr-binding forkhead associated (FHA) protein
VQLAVQEPRWAESLARDRPVATPAPAFNGGQTTVVAVPSSTSHGTHDAPHTETIPATALNAAELILSRGQRQLSRWSLPNGKLRIGRALDNDLRIEDKAISRHHCTVTTDADSSTIEDLGSVNGLIINGHSVRRHILAHADRVQIGDHTITYLLQSSSPDR